MIAQHLTLLMGLLSEHTEEAIKLPNTTDEDRERLAKAMQSLEELQVRVMVLMPPPCAFPYKHGRDIVRRRKRELDKATDELHNALEWIRLERNNLHAHCLGHNFSSGDARDPGGHASHCSECGAPYSR